MIYEVRAGEKKCYASNPSGNMFRLKICLLGADAPTTAPSETLNIDLGAGQDGFRSY